MTLPGEGSKGVQPDQLIDKDADDMAAIQASPYPEALEHWRERQAYMYPQPHESLEPHVGPAIKALRDHVVFEEGGVTELMELLAEGAASTTIHGTHERFTAAAVRMQEALAAESPADRDEQLDLALMDADSTIKDVVEGYEKRALGVPGVTEAFAGEVLVDSPPHGKDPISEDALAELLAFDDGPDRTKALKITRFGRILYDMHGSLSPRGIQLTFTHGLDFMDGKTGHEVIDTGSAEELEALASWAAGLRGTTAS